MVVSTVRGGGPNLSQAPGPLFELPIPLDGRPLGKVSDFQSFKYIYIARETLFTPIVEIVEEVVTRLAAPDRLVGLLGGEHSITVGAVTALAGSHPDISVLYLDAHADLRDEYMGSRWGHASVARRLHEVCPLVEVGVRSLSLGERRFIRDNEIPVVFWPPANGDGQRLAETVIDALTPAVYVSIDLDVLDPALMPAVGAPEPGGMSWHDLIGLVRAVARERKIVGFDVTELSPGEGPEAGAFTAAKLVQKVIWYSVPAA